MSTSQVYHLEIDEGAHYTRTFYYEDSETGLPIDLTGYSARMEVRQKYDGYDNPCAVMSYSSATADLGYGLILGGTAGTVTLTIKGHDTRNLLWMLGVYDIMLISPENVRKKFLSGFVTIIPSVTKTFPGDPDDTGNVQIIVQSGTPVKVSGTSIETVLATILLPGNSVKPNGRLEIDTFFQTVSSPSWKWMRVSMDGLLLNSIRVAAVNGTEFSTNLLNNADGSEQRVWFGETLNYREIGNWVTYNMDMTQDHFITITGQLDDPAEFLSLNGFTVKAINPL